MSILSDVGFWQALTGLAWPIVVLVIAFRFRELLVLLFQRDQLTFKVAGMEISVAEATEQVGRSVSDLQERIAKLEARGAGAEGTVEGETAAAPRVAEGSILWVDDYPSNNAFIIDRLEREGVRVRKELSTDAAMVALKEDRFDVVISDLGRVERGHENPFAGLELVRAMAAAGLAVPTQIFAGSRGLDNKDKLLAAGATAVAASAVDVFTFVDTHVRKS